MGSQGSLCRQETLQILTSISFHKFLCVSAWVWRNKFFKFNARYSQSLEACLSVAFLSHFLTTVMTQAPEGELLFAKLTKHTHYTRHLNECQS